MKPTLLIAEGDSELCEMYQTFLTDRGYEVETASDGLSCLARLRRLMPAVLVLDLELRWGGGDGVLAWLREQSTCVGVAVVLMATGGYPLVNSTLDIKPPVVKFLPKPFSLGELLESVRTAVADKAREEPFYLYRKASCSELYIG